MIDLENCDELTGYYVGPPKYPIKEEVKDDVVKHPSHYCYSKYEPKDVIREWGVEF